MSKLSGLLIGRIPPTAAVLSIYLLAIPLATSAESSCEYVKRTPSVEGARQSFRLLEFECAEEELLILLRSDTLSPATGADAHVLLAAVYFEASHGATSEREKVTAHLRAAMKLKSDWAGSVDIQSAEFVALIEQARAAIRDRDKTERIENHEEAPGDDSMRYVEPLRIEVKRGLSPLAKSALFAGWGQYARGDRKRGIVFATAEVLALGASVVTVRHYNGKVDKYRVAEERFSSAESYEEAIQRSAEMSSSHQAAEDARGRATIACAAAVGIWLANLLEAYLVESRQQPPETRSSSVGFHFQNEFVAPRDGVLISVTVGF